MWDEVYAVALLVSVPEQRERGHSVTRRGIAIEEKIELILDTLRGEGRVEFSELVKPWKERLHGVMTLLAGLELARRHLLTLRQIQPFHELWLYPRENAKEDDAGVVGEHNEGADASGEVETNTEKEVDG